MKTKSLFTWFAASAMLVGLAGCQQPEPEAVLSSLKITDPTKMNYKVGEQFNKAGLVVEAVYSNDYKKQVSDNEYTLNPADGYTFTAADFDAGEKEFTVTYTDKEVTKTGTFTVKVIDSDPVQTGITANVKEGTTYFVGDNFDPSTIEVFKVYDKTLNPERMESGYTLSLDSTYVFTEADQAGKTLTVTAGEFTFPVQLTVVERTWTQKVEKWLLDTYELEPYSKDESGQTVGDYNLSPLWMVLDDYTDNPISFPIEEKEDEDGKYLKLHVETSDDGLINEIFSAYVGLAMLPHYFEEYYLDLALPVWNAKDLFSMYISGDFVIYTMPNENGDYVVFESHLSSTQTTVTSDIYIYTEKAYSAAQASALIEQTLSSETYGIAEPGFATSAEALAVVSDWFYLLPIEDGFTLAAPFYSGAGEDLEIRSALEEAVNTTKWEIDNQFYEFAGGFARSEAKNEKGLQAVANYYQPNDTFETFFKNLPEFTAYYNLFNIDFYLDTPQVTFKKFLEDTNAELVKAGFTDTVIPSISVQGIEGKTESDEKEFDVGFMSYENLAEESYQDKYAKAFPADKWTVKVGESYLTVTSKEVAKDKLVRIYVQSDIENHQFSFEVTLIDNVKAWPTADIATYVTTNGFDNVVVPALDGEDWFVKYNETDSFYYIHKPVATLDDGVALLDSYIALFDTTKWQVNDGCEYEPKEGGAEGETVRTTFEYEMKSLGGTEADKDACINVYARVEDGEIKISIGADHIKGSFRNDVLSSALALQGYDTSMMDTFAASLGAQYGLENATFATLVDNFIGKSYHVNYGQLPDTNTLFFMCDFDFIHANQIANLAYFFAQGLGYKYYPVSQTSYLVTNDAESQDLSILVRLSSDNERVELVVFIDPNPVSFNAATVNAALAAYDCDAKFSPIINTLFTSGVETTIDGGEDEVLIEITFAYDTTKEGMGAAYLSVLDSALQNAGFEYVESEDGYICGENATATLDDDGKGTITIEILAMALPEPAHQLYGTWTGKVGVNNQTFVFNDDNSGSWNGSAFTYALSETGKVTFSCNGYDFELTYNAEAQTLVGEGDDGDYPIEISFNAENYTAPAEEPEQKSYVGSWSGSLFYEGNSVSIVLNADGTGSFGGTAFEYTVEKGIITFVCGDIEFACTYDAENDRLLVSAVDSENNEVEDKPFTRAA